MEYEPFELVDDGTLDTVLRCRYCRIDVRVSPEPPDDPDEDWDRVAAAMDLAKPHLDECTALVCTVEDDESSEYDHDDYNIYEYGQDYDEYDKDDFWNGWLRE